MPTAPRLPRWMPALRNRRGAPSRQHHAAASAASMQPNSTLPPRLRKRDILLRGPQLLLRGPGLLLRAPQAVWRAPAAARAGTRRFLSGTALRSRQQPQQRPQGIDELSQLHAETSKTAAPTNASEPTQEEARRQSFATRLKKRWKETPTKWSPIPVSLGAAVLVVLTLYKQASDKGKEPMGEGSVHVQGPWQVHVIGALPLRSISRLYGLVNSYELPVWFRVPGYKFYSWVFGVNLDECEPSDLTEYRSMSEFFMRRLKPGVRPIADAPLVSPADGRVINFGVIEDGRIQSIKGATYSLEALLQGAGKADVVETPHGLEPHPHNAEAIEVDEKDFANVNGISYSLDKLMGGRESENAAATTGAPQDASLSESEQKLQRDGPKRTLSSEVAVATEIAKSAFEPREGHKLYFTVIYLAPGDYHRFHSPTNWVVERRRHFAGELFSVSPWMVGKLADLFVLNERVALLGRWRYGSFAYIPVGATNVGSIRVNFDSSLRTNSPLRPVVPGTFSEATYSKASTMLGGQPLRAGDEIGGFWLGSTIVLVFEAPEFHFNIHNGQKLKVGEALGHIAT
ncbi:hypothetical protein JCM8115_004733 [Rhodotorula mucilaginosa]|nr:hypothetical protein B0A53_02847 [Rhodotorula sp. CCFEE 5036]